MEHQLSKFGLIPVVKLETNQHAEGLADALIAGGLPIAEITLRTEGALGAIETLSRRNDICIGAGTVLNADQAAKSIEAGAQFVVSPGLDSGVVAYCQKRDIDVYPGVSSATEIQTAYNLGLRHVKFFPAEAAGGVPTLKALAAPFQEMMFIPTGGINPTNARDYLDLECTLAIGGSWMVKPALYASGDFTQVTELTASAIQLIKSQDDRD